MFKWKTIVLSDLHIGSNHSKLSKLLKFLAENKADNYFLNGDILDLTEIQKGNGVWNKKSTRVVSEFVEISKKAKVTYILGNHEKMLRPFLPFKIGSISFQNSAVYKGIDGRSYYFFHGDKIKAKKDTLSTVAGNLLYDLLLKIDVTYNNVRNNLKLKEQSVALFVKENLSAIQIMETNFKAATFQIAKDLGHDVAVCGHIHIPHVSSCYMNSGDFSEGSTALVESLNGEWLIINLRN